MSLERGLRSGSGGWWGVVCLWDRGKWVGGLGVGWGEAKELSVPWSLRFSCDFEANPKNL